MTKQIETYIEENLSGEAKRTALELVEFLRDNELTFSKDTCDCWRDKIYYWVKLGDECVCFIAIKDPDEPDNLWTIWSDDSSAYENASVSDELQMPTLVLYRPFAHDICVNKYRIGKMM